MKSRSRRLKQLDDAITAIDLARSGVTLTMTGAAAPGGVATIDAGGLYPGSRYYPSNVTIAGSVDVTNTAHSFHPCLRAIEFQRSFSKIGTDYVAGLAYNFDDTVLPLSLSPGSQLRSQRRLPGYGVIATELYNGTQTDFRARFLSP